jgi:hypothetical protein
MKKETTQTFSAQSKSNNLVLPLTMAVIGASVVLMAVMLLVNDKKSGNEKYGSYDVENYDVVGNMPFIFGAGE